jgi:hypothetical protein
MIMYDAQTDVESRKLVPYTDPLKRPINSKHVYKSVNTSIVP